MRRSRSSRGGRWLLTTSAMLAPLVCSGCTLVQPGCHNRDVKAAIEHEAREAAELWMSTPGLSAPSPETPITLADQVETSRHDNTRSCSANVVLGSGDEAVAVPIEYEVTAGDDGQAFYRWDTDEFGKQLIGTAFMSALSKAANAKANVQHQPDTATAPDNPPAPVPWPQSATAPLNVVDAWKRSVHATILARAEKLTGMPAGEQRVRFRIGPAGEITMARAVAPVENDALADKLVAFLDATDTVPASPLNKVTWVEVTFHF